MLQLVIAKIRKLIEQDILEYVLPVGSKWSSPIVVLKKSDGDIHTCGDDKVGANYKVCSATNTIPNVKVAIHALAGISVFTNIDLKTAYNQIPKDDNLKEVTTINMLIGLLKRERIPCGKNSKRHI